VVERANGGVIIICQDFECASPISVMTFNTSCLYHEMQLQFGSSTLSIAFYQ
jgi:hypothetical protein